MIIQFRIFDFRWNIGIHLDSLFGIRKLLLGFFFQFRAREVLCQPVGYCEMGKLPIMEKEGVAGWRLIN
jgi:hypothetical protein